MTVYLVINFTTREVYVHTWMSKVDAVYDKWREQGYDCKRAVADAEED
jgi:hypothetical protein